MRTTFFIVLLTAISYACYAQDTVDVVEKTIKVSAMSREVDYFGFAEGDKVIFNLTVERKKDLKDITVSEYPNSVRFADHTTDKVQNKVLNISRNGIFVFEYHNSNISGRTVNLKIQRIPKSESTKFFNTNVKWENRVDTFYSAQARTFIVKSDTSIVEVIDAKVRVHSQTNIDNPNRTLTDFILPANTMKWTYWIGVGNEGQAAYKKDQASFSKSGAKIIGSINPLAGLAFGIVTMSHANVGENVKYYFIRSQEDVQKFKSGQSFMQFKQGNVVTDFGLMNYGVKQNTKVYLGLVNDNISQGLDVNVKVLAVVVKNEYDSIIEKVPNYTNTAIPVHEQ